MTTTEPIDISMSDLAAFRTCRKKFEYSFVRGWYPRSVTKSMVLGTAYHEKLAAGYRAVQEYDLTHDRYTQGFNNQRPLAFIEAAVAYQPSEDRDGRVLPLDQADYELLEDMVRYWFAEVGEADLAEIEEIMSVEQPHYMTLLGYRIRCTLDVIVRRFGDGGSVSVVDHKTGDPQSAASWIYLDTQTPLYYIVARGTYGGVTQFRHQWMAREVPPGFGHRSALTDTGRTRKPEVLANMSKRENFVSVIKTELTDDQLNAYTYELTEILQEITECQRTGRYIRREPIKVGPMRCEGCPYFAPCVAERSGAARMDDSLAALNYLVRGSEEWQAVQDGRTALDVRGAE